MDKLADIKMVKASLFLHKKTTPRTITLTISLDDFDRRNF